MWILITLTPFCLQNWVKFTARTFMISSRLGSEERRGGGGLPQNVVAEDHTDSYLKPQKFGNLLAL